MDKTASPRVKMTSATRARTWAERERDRRTSRERCSKSEKLQNAAKRETPETTHPISADGGGGGAEGRRGAPTHDEWCIKWCSSMERQSQSWGTAQCFKNSLQYVIYEYKFPYFWFTFPKALPYNFEIFQYLKSRQEKCPKSWTAHSSDSKFFQRMFIIKGAECTSSV